MNERKVHLYIGFVSLRRALGCSGALVCDRRDQ